MNRLMSNKLMRYGDTNCHMLCNYQSHVIAYFLNTHIPFWPSNNRLYCEQKFFFPKIILQVKVHGGGAELAFSQVRFSKLHWRGWLAEKKNFKITLADDEDCETQDLLFRNCYSKDPPFLFKSSRIIFQSQNIWDTFFGLMIIYRKSIPLKHL